MKASIAWLKSLTPTTLDAQGLVSSLTMAGLEVDAVVSIAHPFTDVVVAEVRRVEAHPEADKLHVCQVFDGVREWQVVCGAPNVRVGLKAPLARVGAQLTESVHIHTAMLRGVESHGMLCGADELGLAEERAGLMELPGDAPVGSTLQAYLSLPDHALDVDLTPNRGDCLSITGLARELGVLTDASFTPVSIVPVAATSTAQLPVQLEAPSGCPKYVGRVIEHVDVTRATPLWMVERLRRSGIRSIDAVVDITNYVMLELGQPMHAFDREQLADGIVVRFAHPDETLVLLDGRTVVLSEDVLVIADHQKPLALAGVMGGEHSGIQAATRHVFLESAFFDPITIAGRARRFGLHTDASQRFERGVDWALAEQALERATALLIDVCGGNAGPTIVIESPTHQPTRPTIRLRRARLAQQLALGLPDPEVTAILESLGMMVTQTSEGWLCEAPSWRFDLGIEQDLVEEVARVYGYNRLPTSLPAQAISMAAQPEAVMSVRRLKQFLVDADCQEVVTYSFVDPALQAMFEQEPGVRLANPIASNMAEMRRSMLPGLLEACRFNVNRQVGRIRFFETGQCFVPEADGLNQSERLGIVLMGAADRTSWEASRPVDFFDLKGLLDGIVALHGGAQLQYAEANHCAMAPGQTAQVVCQGQPIGWVGRLHPRLARALDLVKPVYLADLSLSPLLTGAVTTFEMISRYPSVKRDIAVVVPEDTSWGGVQACLESVHDERLRAIELFDVYRGDSIGKELKSFALSLTFQAKDSTLDESEIAGLMVMIMTRLKTELGATIRE